MELNALRAARGDDEPTEVLWSAATAGEIVADIARDIELGRMSRAEGLALIHRVRERAAPAPDGRDRVDVGGPRRGPALSVVTGP